MIRINPYLNFAGNCRDAMSFYKDCLGADLEMQTVGESPAAQHMPIDTHNQILHSRLSKNNVTLFMASDMIMGETYKSGNNVWITLTGELNEIKDAYSKLAQGGKILQELKTEFFGTFGSLEDKFGMNWMFQSDAKLES